MMVSLEQHIEAIKPHIQAYAQNQLTEQSFLKILLDFERNNNWRFALDGSILQFRDKQGSIVVDFDKKNGSFTSKSLPFPQTIEPKNDEHSLIRKIKETNIVVGISGPARKPININKVDARLRKIYEKYQPDNTMILTGGYPDGVPYRAQEVANEMGFGVMAVVPQVIYQPHFLNSPKRFQATITVGDHWGEETPTFVSLIDELYVFEGGGPWTQLEFDLAKGVGIHPTLVKSARNWQG